MAERKDGEKSIPLHGRPGSGDGSFAKTEESERENDEFDWTGSESLLSGSGSFFWDPLGGAARTGHSFHPPALGSQNTPKSSVKQGSPSPRLLPLFWGKRRDLIQAPSGPRGAGCSVPQQLATLGTSINCFPAARPRWSVCRTWARRKRAGQRPFAASMLVVLSWALGRWEMTSGPPSFEPLPLWSTRQH